MNLLSQALTAMALIAGMLGLLAVCLWIIVEIHINYHRIYGGRRDEDNRH